VIWQPSFKRFPRKTSTAVRLSAWSRGIYFSPYLRTLLGPFLARPRVHRMTGELFSALAALKFGGRLRSLPAHITSPFPAPHQIRVSSWPNIAAVVRSGLLLSLAVHWRSPALVSTGAPAKRLAESRLLRGISGKPVLTRLAVAAQTVQPLTIFIAHGCLTTLESPELIRKPAQLRAL